MGLADIIYLTKTT